MVAAIGKTIGAVAYSSTIFGIKQVKRICVMGRLLPAFIYSYAVQAVYDGRGNSQLVLL